MYVLLGKSEGGTGRQAGQPYCPQQKWIRTLLEFKTKFLQPTLRLHCRSGKISPFLNRIQIKSILLVELMVVA